MIIIYLCLIELQWELCRRLRGGLWRSNRGSSLDWEVLRSEWGTPCLFRFVHLDDIPEWARTRPSLEL